MAGFNILCRMLLVLVLLALHCTTFCLALTPEEMEKEREEAATVFSDADSSVRKDFSEQGFRNMFSKSKGNEFVNMDEAVKSALLEIEVMRKIMESADGDITDQFDADGVSLIPIADMLSGNGTAEDDKDKVETRSFVDRHQRVPCMYIKAQNQPCMSTFREPTGRCTSLIHDRKTWGMATTPYTRILPQNYEDGLGETRKTGFSSGRTLLNGRAISTFVTSNRVKLDEEGFNAQIMQWGQFISHEFTQLSEFGEDVACCPDQIYESKHGSSRQPSASQLELIRKEIKRLRGHICIEIENENDPIYGDHICMSQTRSKPASRHDCSVGPRQQMNAVTHVFDGSSVYGSSAAEQRALRTLSGGKLKTQKVGRFTLPPQDRHDCRAEKLAVNQCPFMAGDSRINTTPNLIATHTVFLMKHNQIAESLGQLNRHWNDERIFLETRRIIAAIQTNIHYYEYLPIIVGPRIINKYRLSSYAGFDEDVNPSVLNELAGAAMRFGHSTVDGFYSIIRDDGHSAPFENLRFNFNNGSRIYQRGVREFIKGLLVDKPWDSDNKFPEQMRDTLFNQNRDIVAININRGRDHGFQSYVNYRRHYGLSVPSTFEDLRDTHSPNVIEGFRKAYSTVKDIELYIGGVTETVAPSTFVGELFANIIGDGFSRLARGDRFFFESPQSGLTSAQIQTIRKYKYHQLLCESADIQRIVSNAFLRLNSRKVSEVECSRLEPLNLNLWKEDLKNQRITTQKPSTNRGRPSTRRPPTRPISTSCHWQVTDMTNCCTGFGKRTTTRECVGGENCQCSGPSTLTSLCRCRGEVCAIEALRHRCAKEWRRLGIDI